MIFKLLILNKSADKPVKLVESKGNWVILTLSIMTFYKAGVSTIKWVNLGRFLRVIVFNKGELYTLRVTNSGLFSKDKVYNLDSLIVA